MNKEIAQYINSLLAERERLLDERKDLLFGLWRYPRIKFYFKTRNSMGVRNNLSSTKIHGLHHVRRTTNGRFN